MAHLYDPAAVKAVSGGICAPEFTHLTSAAEGTDRYRVTGEWNSWTVNYNAAVIAEPGSLDGTAWVAESLCDEMNDDLDRLRAWLAIATNEQRQALVLHAET